VVHSTDDIPVTMAYMPIVNPCWQWILVAENAYAILWHMSMSKEEINLQQCTSVVDAIGVVERYREKVFKSKYMLTSPGVYAESMDEFVKFRHCILEGKKKGHLDTACANMPAGMLAISSMGKSPASQKWNALLCNLQEMLVADVGNELLHEKYIVSAWKVSVEKAEKELQSRMAELGILNKQLAASLSKSFASVMEVASGTSRGVPEEVVKMIRERTVPTEIQFLARHLVQKMIGLDVAGVGVSNQKGLWSQAEVEFMHESAGASDAVYKMWVDAVAQVVSTQGKQIQGKTSVQRTVDSDTDRVRYIIRTPFRYRNALGVPDFTSIPKILNVEMYIMPERDMSFYKVGVTVEEMEPSSLPTSACLRCNRRMACID